MRRLSSVLVIAALATSLAACGEDGGASDPVTAVPADASSTASATTQIVPQPGIWSEPANVGNAKKAAEAYMTSGDYMRDVAAVDAQAQDWIETRAPQVTKPAFVFDIDETALSNLPQIKADDWGYFDEGTCDRLPKGPCGFVAWEARIQAPAIQPTLKLYQFAKSHGVAVFFVTGRQQASTAVTAENLHRVGYSDWKGLFLAPEGKHPAHADEYKAPVREKIEAQGYTIIGTIGDQTSDLVGGHAERGFKLPNPFYFIP